MVARTIGGDLSITASSTSLRASFDDHLPPLNVKLSEGRDRLSCSHPPLINDEAFSRNSDAFFQISPLSEKQLTCTLFKFYPLLHFHNCAYLISLNTCYDQKASATHTHTQTPRSWREEVEALRRLSSEGRAFTVTLPTPTPALWGNICYLLFTSSLDSSACTYYELIPRTHYLNRIKA